MANNQNNEIEADISFQVAVFSFPRQNAELSFRDMLRTLVIREGLRVELVLLHIGNSQLRWSWQLTRMPPGQLSNWEKPHGRPRTQWTEYVSQLT